MLFGHLFDGGEAQLEMVESDDPLMPDWRSCASHPGKRLSTLPLFSWREQSLTALALIFAVFLANPAPVCVLDEVDAPDRNTVPNHHAITMDHMDRLFGVTMGEMGVSQLVSVDLGNAERLAS